MRAAIDALEVAFRTERPGTPMRSHVDLPEGSLYLMPSFGAEGAGVKLLTLNPTNPERGLPFIHGAYVLFAPTTLAVDGVIEGAALTGLRTAAVSGLATRWLARRDAARLVIFGAGAQAYTHLDAMRAVCPIGEVVVVSRTRSRAEELVAHARGLDLSATAGEPEAVAEADIVCTCTTSDQPLFDGSLLADGAHVNAIGAYTADAREIDAAVVRRAGRVVVETTDSALEEAGDVVLAIADGALTDGDLVELSDVVRGAGVRASDEDVTLFKSVGVAFEDLAVARAAVEAAGG
jgi:ornithine cyclodeaminase/alanine dehydrogenase-like protein (mu-crystallin family)